MAKRRVFKTALNQRKISADMKLEPATRADTVPFVNIHDRFRKEVHKLPLPKKIRLEGNAMHVKITKRLIAKHAPYLEVDENAEIVRVMSLEEYGIEFLKGFMGAQRDLKHLVLLSTIPDRVLREYAKSHGIRVIDDEPCPVRTMVERIAKEQPQTFFALRKSAERIEPLLKK